MATITIDGKEYDLETLSGAAKGQLQSVQVVDRKIADVQAELAILQTARNAYVNGLKAELPADE